jgi:hypothetical protein
METTKKKQVFSTFKVFRDTGLITKKDVIENQEELHKLCTDVIIYADGFYVQMLSDGYFYYNNKYKADLTKEVIFKSKVLNEVEEIVYTDYAMTLI